MQHSMNSGPSSRWGTPLVVGIGLASMGTASLASETVEEQTRILVVGGAGDGDPTKTLHALQERLRASLAQRTVLVFTGNYLRQGELPEAEHEERDEAESALQGYVRVARDLRAAGGRVFFLPGHRDYGSGGRRGPRRLRRFLEDSLHSEDEHDELSVMPVADCAEPEVLELEDGVTVLAFVNSQWWMQDHSQDEKANQGCEFKRRAQLAFAFEGIVKKYRTKRLVVLAHHPLRSHGPYGGRFRPVDYAWPPVLGLFDVVGKQTGLFPQYRSHPLYSSYADTIAGSAKKFGSFVFASGHDRSLQVLDVDSQVQVVSGAGSEETTAVGGASDGGHTAARNGWAEIDVDPEGRGAVRLVDVSGEVLFQRHLAALPSFHPKGDPPPELPTGPVISRYTRESHGRTNFFERVFLGRHYRDAYDLKLEFYPLDLAQRGLVPIRVGGGAQTNSLRLVDDGGGQWALRATTKDSSRFLPYPLGRIGLVAALVDDAFTASHPEAALTVPPLAEAAGIYHTRPRLVLLPDQPALGEYRGYLGDEVALLERRPEEPDRGRLPAHLGGERADVGAPKFDSSTRMLERLRKKPWKYSVDQENMLRARLLDMLIGDWDRHEDQWRFVRIPQADGTWLYRPIPRDRDQAFAHYDGFFLALGRLAAPEIRILGTFDDRIGDPTWLNYGARHIDSHLLNRLDRETWMSVARDVQSATTDEVIAEAVGRLRPPAYDLDGATIERKLRGRRDDLVRAAASFYEQLNEKAVVLGSEKRDLVHLHFLDEKRVRLQLRRAKQGPSGVPWYDRIFDAKDTGEIHLYTLSGHDEIVVFGEPHDAIRIRVLGGRKKDLVRADAPPGGRLRAKMISVYDLPDGLEIDPTIRVDDQRSTDPYKNQYDRKDPHYEPAKVGFIPGLVINPDDGLFLGGTLQASTPGFKRRPYDLGHTFSAFFATATLGVRGSYELLIPRSLGAFDQTFGIDGTTPRFTRNFFGLTNAFIDPSDDRDFFRLRQSTVHLRYGPSRTLGRGLWRAGIDLEGIFVDTDRTEGRNIDELAEQGAVDVRALRDRYFVGTTGWLRLDSRGRSTYPKRGVFGEVYASTRIDLTEDGDDRRFDTLGLFGGSLGGNYSFDRTGRVVLGTRVRAEGIVGDYLFYWAPTLGSRELRAYNDEQLAGDFVVSQSTDLRLEVIRISRGLPGVIGIAAAIDHGRAFGDGIPGDEYHVTTGGTLFWNIAGLVGVGASYHVGIRDPAERQRFVLLIGPLFSESGFRR
jgi:hypothetical protein